MLRDCSRKVNEVWDRAIPR